MSPSRGIVVVSIFLVTACSRADTPSPAADTAARDTAAKAIGSVSPPDTTTSSAFPAFPTIVPVQVAKWRGSTVPDRIDSLLAAAFSAKGEYSGDGEEYGFSGSESAVEELRKIPQAIPRLVECLGWDERAAAEFNGAKVLVGVVCYQAMLGTEYNIKLNNEGAFPLAGQIDYSNPSIDTVRKAQLEWRKVLTTHPPQEHR